MRGCPEGEVAQKINSQLYRNNNCGGSSGSSRRKQRTRVKEKQKKNT